MKRLPEETHSMKRLSTMSLLPWWLGTLICLLIAACSPWRDAYLKDTVDHGTQADVREKLGPPHMIKDALLNDETVWIYRYALSESELHPYSLSNVGRAATEVSNQAASMIGVGGGQGNSPEKVSCVHYVLTFDQAKVLQQWKRESCSSGWNSEG